MAESEIDISMALIGPPKVRGRFAKAEARITAAYQATLDDIASWYSEQVKERFAETHGQSGETAESISYQPRVVSRDLYILDVRVGGHAGFVINPLPTHPIAINRAPALGNFEPTGAAVGRMSNFFSEFGPRITVEWKQGGVESHSPDTSWFEGEDSDLYAEASRQLHKLAGFVQLAWADANSGPTTLSRALARYQYTYLRNR